MKLVKLTQDTNLIGFDCGDEDLNNFLVEDAKGFLYHYGKNKKNGIAMRYRFSVVHRRVELLFQE